MNALPLLAALATLTTAEPAPAPEAEAAATPAPAGSILLAPKVGFFKSTTPLSGDLYLAAEVGYVTPLLERRLAVVLEVNYHRPTIKGTLTDPQLGGFGQQYTGDYSVAVREVAFLLSAVYRFERALGAFTPYAGGGPGLYLHRSTSDFFGNIASESGGRLGFQALGGLEWALGPGGAFVEAHYHFAPVGDEFITTGDVNVGGFLAALGFRFRL
jgi:opacity protein-like surface antigen